MGGCVRRAFLCGEDGLSGKDYSHRKLWIIDSLKELAKSFTIEVCAYAVMSNHYHLVLKINDEKAKLMSDRDAPVYSLIFLSLKMGSIFIMILVSAFIAPFILPFSKSIKC